MKPTGSEYAANAIALPDMGIPYVSNGSTVEGMDCQGLMEYLLRQVGVKRNWAGSNAMWRDMVWRGTPEECVAEFGSVPVGAWLYIVSADDSGAPAKYRGDGLGNASHVGVKVANGVAVHASASRGCVATSKFSDKTVRNGGWNMVGLCGDLDYGADVTASISGAEAGEDGEAKKPMYPRIDTSKFFKIKRGCRGGAVLRLQTWLIDAGYDLGVHGSDSIFGAMTEQAVRDFQSTHGLVVDGIVGKKTWAALADMRWEAVNRA